MARPEVPVTEHHSCGCKTCGACDPLTVERMVNLLVEARKMGVIDPDEDLKKYLVQSIATGGPTILRTHEGFPMVIFANDQQERDVRDKWDEIFEAVKP